MENKNWVFKPTNFIKSYNSLEKIRTIITPKETDLYRIVTDDPDNWHLVANQSIARGALFSVMGVSSLVDVHGIEFIDIILEETQERKRVYTAVYAVPSNVSCAPDTLEIPWCFMNHSCEPNTHDRWDTENLAEFRATKNISKGEELTYDYNKEQYDYRSPFECQCGNESCRGMIYGFNGLCREEQKRLLSHVSPLVQEKYLRRSINNKN